MNRVVKFRVWDKDLKHMHVCGEDVHDSIGFLEDGTSYYYNLQNGCGSLGDDASYKLMQFTGLTDIMGKEIYEQDICSCPNKEMIVVICYDINQTRFKAVPVELFNANAGNGGWTGYEVKGYFEVIGSIYTHPHLLEVSNG